MTYTISRNDQFNSLEIAFDGKPCEAIRDALKALRFRWHGVRRVWYGYADEQTTRAAGGSYDKYVAAYVRKHLRERFPECKISVTSGGAGYLNAVNIEIKSSPFAREFVKGDGDWNSRNQYDHYENSAELDAVLKYCEKLLDVFDDDDGDHYADYGAHHDLYGSARIAYEYTQTEATAEQAESAADFDERKAEAEAAEEARRAAEWAERDKQMEQERAEAERLEKIRTEQAEEIAAHVEILDLQSSEQIAAVGLLESYGKENTLEEVRKSIEERRAEGRESRTDAVISRKVNFKDRRIFDNFCGMLLRNFEFLNGKGGTMSDDARLTEDMELFRLNEEQRESVKFFLIDCVAVYLDGVFQFVIDPQGFSYARYVLIADEATDSYKAEEKRAEWRESSEALPAFYFPAPISEQITAADLQNGDEITMIHLDPWIMTATRTSAIVNRWGVTDYAQYKNVALLSYTPQGKRNPEQIHIKDGQPCAIFRGILPDVPDSIKYTDCGGNLQRVNYSGEGAKDYIIQAIEYYRSIGYDPVIDTIQR